MPKFIVLHSFRTSPEAYAQAYTSEAIAEFAQANALREYPAQCLMTWDPTQHGRQDMMVCLWQADRPEQVMQVITQMGLDQHLTSDIMLVEETDWLNLAQATH